MLKLKRVEIHGFKSFYDRTEMKFNGQGIAAVVGPNGCGKSNLSDAINWVLGEQSAKSLRGARMEDVIFAGTRERKPLGMASVTMTLVADELRLARDVPAAAEPAEPSENTGEPQPELEAAVDEHGDNRLDHGADVARQNGHAHSTVKADAEKTAERRGEITITRRLYRSGESEYLINGKLARLRDIQDLFLGTGLGPESYAIIEQGRIGQILSNRPQDRRAVIEEAAGITKFKTRKRLAEAKLEGAKQNLARVFDILEEVTRQVNSLKRQAAKTKRYGELKAEMIGYLRQVLAAKFQVLERETAKAAIELNFAGSELQDLQTAITLKEEEQTKVLEISYAIDKELTDARKRLADLQLEAERARGRFEYQLKQISQIEQRLSTSEAEAAELGRQQIEHTGELEQHAADLQALEEERSTAREALEAKSAERQQAQNQLSERERAQEASRQQLLRLLNEASSLKNRVAQTEAQLAALDRETARADGELRQAESDLSRIQRIKTNTGEQLAARQTELNLVTEERRSIESALQGKRASLSESRQTLDRVRSEYSRVKARKDSLEEVISHRSYTTETVKRLFTAIAKNEANDLKPVGVLADFLEVDSQYEKATEEFLHEELEYVVVHDWQDAERGMDLLRAGIDGRATFLVESLETGPAPATGPEPSSENGVVTRLRDVLHFTNGLTQASFDLVPRVARCYVAADRAAAQRLATAYPDCWFLTQDGVSYHDHAVSGGKKTGAGPLALKRELREVSQLERAKQQELTNAQTHLSTLEREIAELTEQLEYLRQRQQTQEKDVLALDHESRKLAEEFQRVNQRLSAARLELDRIARDRVRHDESLAQTREQLAQKETARVEQEEALESAREELHDLQASVARVGEEHSTLRASLASFEERHRSLSSNKARLEHRLREISGRIENLGRERERLTAERAQFLANNEELAAQSGEFQQAITALDSAVRELALRETKTRTQLGASEEELKALRSHASGLQEKRSALQVTMARLESDLNHLQETSQNELQTPLKEVAEGLETIPGEEELAELDQKYQEVRRKIEALGPVNPQALEEYEEAQQRQDFLNAQRQDLLDSIRDTEKAIHEIDVESRKRFTEAFHAINGNFTEMFKTLFGGGLAEMRLTDEENVNESGIEIVASPPGKRLQSVLLLSGGEKALTAMALLMAVFQYTPSPFCILDEVDAPLDEPNTHRLTRLLGAMSEQTQFIVITHSKRTMEAAQSLYGVTMQEPGVSRLVSVKFKPIDEVERNEHAAQAAKEAKERERELALV